MLKEKAYAKINLFLNVVGKRIDGYHDLEMIMAPLELHDLLTFKENDSSEVNITSSKVITSKKKDNVVYKVAMYLKEEFNISKGVDITIQKNIPIAAGLAGGSADAAATIRALNKMWKLKLNKEEMAQIGEKFGADIPFCIYNHLCIARGKGEELFFIKKKLKFPVLLINPNIKLSTKEVFDSYVSEDTKVRKISDMSAGIYNKNIDIIIRELHNSLESSAFKMEPKIQALKNDLIDKGLKGTLMSGSGATVFSISKDKQKLKVVHETFGDNYTKILTRIR
ncbi:MAG: 4-(cytidine 5'-diphospho)-2-C-methyl-D-erythritol kinase [Candidatus Izemoplasma sp.]